MRLYRLGVLEPGAGAGCTSGDNWRVVDESVAIGLARNGDGDAFATLVTRYQDLAFRTAYLITGDATEAEDAAQSAFVKAYFGLRAFDSARPFRPWLMTIVANEARNKRTAASRHRTVDLAALEGFEPVSADTQPDEAAVAALAAEHLVDMINRLREEDRAIIAMRYFLDLTEVELAAALDCPRGTVKSRLSRAMDRLRGMLIEDGGDGSG